MPKIYLLISVCNYINAIHIKYIANSNVESDVDFNKFQITLDLIEITTGNAIISTNKLRLQINFNKLKK